YELGQAAGAVTMFGLGVAMAYKGYSMSRTSLAPAPVSQAATAIPQPIAPAGDDFFFAGTVTSTASTPIPPTNATIGHTREQADYRQPLTPSPKPWSNNASIAWMVGGCLLACVGLFTSFHALTPAPGRIQMPDQIAGMTRVDPDSDLGQALEEAFSAAEGTPIGADLQAAAYQGDQQTLIIAATDVSGSSSADDEFLTRTSQPIVVGGASTTFHDVDTGSLDGQIRCAVNTQSATAFCMWLGDQTLGVMSFHATTLDVDATAQAARAAVVH
ncbi:MAG TPA: hypothetical protein VMT88_10160, partial [Actinomycetes bacterium]|nr:hypothetical protein [Actinomycetes bacterium]